jgi:hypothetical protein
MNAFLSTLVGRECIYRERGYLCFVSVASCVWDGERYCFRFKSIPYSYLCSDDELFDVAERNPRLESGVVVGEQWMLIHDASHVRTLHEFLERVQRKAEISGMPDRQREKS